MPGRSSFYKVCNADDTNNPILSKDDIEAYHTITTQRLYISKRAQPDLKISIAFYCTLVKKSNEDNHKTFKRTIRHLEATNYLPMILKIIDDGIIERWLDTCFVVHDAKQNRNSMNVSIVRGSVYAVSVK